MKAQTSAYLVKSQETLDDANKSFEVGMAGQAARLAYLAAFHAAQALIMEMTSKAAKTHKGVHARFAELARTHQIERSHTRFLSAAYHFKEAVDYETGDLRIVSAADAELAMAAAREFVTCIQTLLENFQ